TAEDKTKVYGEEDPAFTVSYTGFVNGDEETSLGGTLDITREPGEDVDTYAITASGYTSGNYTISYTAGTLEITPAALMVTAEDKTKVYGEEDPAFTVSYTGFVNGDEEAALGGTLDITREPGEDVDTYAITASGYTSDNYTISYTAGVLEITHRVVTISFAAGAEITKTYDGTVSAHIEASDLAFASGDVVNGDNVFITLATGTGTYDTEDAGEDKEVTLLLDEISLTGTDAGNYTLGNTTAIQGNVGRILPAEISDITFPDGTFVYDGTIKSLYIEGTLPEGTSVQYTDNTRIDAGVQTAVAVITGADYVTVELSAVLTIEKASQQLTFPPVADREDTDPDFQLDAMSDSGLPVSYTYSYTSEDPAATVTEEGMVTLLSSGEITITAHQEGNENYLPAVPVSRTLTIYSANAAISSLEINGTVYDKPGSEIYYLVDCGDTESQNQVYIRTSDPNAVVTPGRSFVIDTPRAGIYTQVVTVTSQDGQQSEQYTITVERRFAFADIVEQKFNNVLIVNNNPQTNGGYRFVKYEWFKDGTFIGSGQYYSAGDDASDSLDPNALYSVQVTTEEGEVLTACASAVILEASATMKVWPNPVLSGEMLHLLADLSQAELSSLSVKVYNQSGREVMRMSSKDKETKISLPRLPGVYLVQCQTNQRTKTFKIIVK
ncbi:Por secretion system C-terminal sorting domain-containing protein, partial [Sinomicrobium oceani]